MLKDQAQIKIPKRTARPYPTTLYCSSVCTESGPQDLLFREELMLCKLKLSGLRHGRLDLARVEVGRHPFAKLMRPPVEVEELQRKQ